MTQTNDHAPVVLFDGVCNLCDGFVQFVLRHEKAGIIQSASLQSASGKLLLEEFNIDPHKTDSIVYIHNRKAYIKSRAVLNILKFLRFPWNAFVVLTIIPPFISDKIYDLVARNRYRLFGKRESCRLPDTEYKARFFEDH